MRDRENRNMACESDEHNAIWEVMDGQRSHIWIVDTWHHRARQRELFKMLKCPSHFLCKSLGNFGVAVTVPSRGFAQLAACSQPETNSFQRDSTSR